MEDLEPWQPLAIMAAYLVTTFGAAFFGINKYYNSKFKKMRDARKAKAKAARENRNWREYL